MSAEFGESRPALTSILTSHEQNLSQCVGFVYRDDDIPADGIHGQLGGWSAEGYPEQPGDDPGSRERL
jgi:hypothetical protein